MEFAGAQCEKSRVPIARARFSTIRAFSLASLPFAPILSPSGSSLVIHYSAIGGRAGGARGRLGDAYKAGGGNRAPRLTSGPAGAKFQILKGAVILYFF